MLGLTPPVSPNSRLRKFVPPPWPGVRAHRAKPRPVRKNRFRYDKSCRATQRKSFSWAGVAASAISAPIINAANNALFGDQVTLANGTTQTVRSQWTQSNLNAALLGQAAVSAGISAATRVVVVGGRLSWEAVAADTLSSFAYSALGSMTAAENAQKTQGLKHAGGLTAEQQAIIGRGGYSEEDYWNSPATTQADRYAQSFGGDVMNVADRGRVLIGQGDVSVDRYVDSQGRRVARVGASADDELNSGGLLIDPATGLPSFGYSSQVRRAQQDVEAAVGFGSRGSTYLSASPEPGLRQQMVNGMSDFLGNSNAAGVAGGFMRSYLNSGENFVSGIVNAPDTAASLASALWNDPLGAVSGGIESLRSGYRTLMSDSPAGMDARGSLLFGITSTAAIGGLGRASAFEGVATTVRQTGAGSGLNAADDLYNAIRADANDVVRIAENSGIKPQNIQKVKDHIFYQEHLLDRYVDYGVKPVWARFDSDFDMANSWLRLAEGKHTKTDLQLLKHEAAEAWYMQKHGPSYLNAHTAADKRYPSPY